MKRINEGVVLKLVRDHGPISRSEIASRTGLTVPTVASMLDSLSAQGLIQEVGFGASRGGRKPLLYEFNPDASLVVGVDVGGTKMAGGITNLAGKVIVAEQLTRETGPPDTYDRLVCLIESLLRQVGPDAPIRGIGLGVAGVINLEQGVVTLAPGLGWSNFPLGQRLEEHFGLPVFLDNDVNAILLGERWFGAARETEDVLCVAVGTGIGAAILAGGQLYRGHQEAAGEVGYCATDANVLKRPPASRGGYGYLEEEAAGPGIARRGTAALGRPVTAPEVMDLAAAGDPVACGVVEETCRHLGLALANMANLLNPALVILTGGVMRGLPVAPVRAIVEHVCPYPPRVVVSELGERAGVLGAVALVLDAGRRSITVG